MNRHARLQEKVIVADPKDNVATARVEIETGFALFCDNGESITLSENIPFGHKLALKSIGKDEPVFKYGQRIGIATRDIAAGELVHVHNLSGERGRNE